MSEYRHDPDVTHTSATEWEIITPRGKFRNSTWKGLVAAVARSFTDEELMRIAARQGSAVTLVQLPFKSERWEFYTTIRERFAIYTTVSARQAVGICRWLSETVDRGGRFEVRRRINVVQAKQAPTPPTVALHLPSTPPVIASRGEDPKTPASTEVGRQPQTPQQQRARLLFAHLAAFGEVTREELDAMGIDDTELSGWLNAMLRQRPGSWVVTPLFLSLLGHDVEPSRFATRVVGHFMGEHFRRHAPPSIPEIETLVWERFGWWHLASKPQGDAFTNDFALVPVDASNAETASEQLGIFEKLPAPLIGQLIRDPAFLAVQQRASEAASRVAGPLSTQATRAWRRPLFLVATRFTRSPSGNLDVRRIPQSRMLKRRFVISGLGLCTAEEWEANASLHVDDAADRLAQHPIAAAIIQFEVHRLLGASGGQVTAALRATSDQVQLDVSGVSRGPLWRHIRTLLVSIGYQPVGTVGSDQWEAAIEAMVYNLTTLGVLHRSGDVVELTDEAAERILGTPRHPQHEGEAHYRDVLTTYLSNPSVRAR